MSNTSVRSTKNYLSRNRSMTTSPNWTPAQSAAFDSIFGSVISTPNASFEDNPIREYKLPEGATQILKTSSLAYFIKHPKIFTNIVKTHGSTPKQFIKESMEKLDSMKTNMEVLSFVEYLDNPSIAKRTYKYRSNQNYLSSRRNAGSAPLISSSSYKK
jgi:hypothetical protein